MDLAKHDLGVTTTPESLFLIITLEVIKKGLCFVFLVVQGIEGVRKEPGSSSSRKHEQLR
jgi:hypothetical protein